MQNIQKTRFIASNYLNLQGLKAVPLGLLLIGVILWANVQKGQARNLSLPILLAFVMAVITWAIYRYYQTRFGKVERTPRQRRLEMLLGIAGGIVGLGAFIGDNIFDLPVSLVGLVFALATVAEYLRMQWYAPGHYLLPASLVFFVIMLVTSILPLLGAGEWWRLLGLRAQMFGVLVVVGAVMVCYGVYEHWYLLRQLPPQQPRTER